MSPARRQTRATVAIESVVATPMLKSETAGNVNNNGVYARLCVAERLGEDDNQHDDWRQENNAAENCRPYELSKRFHPIISLQIGLRMGASQLAVQTGISVARTIKVGRASRVCMAARLTDSIRLYGTNARHRACCCGKDSERHRLIDPESKRETCESERAAATAVK